MNSSTTPYRSTFTLIAALLFFAGCPLLPAQDNAAPATSSSDAANAAPPPETTKTLWEVILQGGWVMIPIGLCSLGTVYLIIDGIIRTGKGKIAPEAHEKRLQSLFQSGDYIGAYQFCKTNPSPLNNVVRIGISLLGDGKQATEEGMIAELAKENSRIQTWISYLSVIGVCSPMLGLLGTVTGMMRAFDKLGSSGIGDPTSLSASIGEVLTATASGLFIAIPAFMAFYFLRNRATVALHHIQDVIAKLFRKMPYETMAGAQIGDEIVFAAVPNWIQATSGAVAYQ
ncbi:MAG TPA: MotA/TolQ/ExbB proton channel family protein [Candidatus Methylacidiphilales bacterium]|nr:MotA/TolQ/ExbB proton channel family protein [Candidatus Methylacidiphilales bacterium]